MALQLNKISRTLLTNGQRLLVNADNVLNNKELHADCSTPQNVPVIPEIKTNNKINENALISTLTKSPLIERPIRAYSSHSCKKNKKPKCNNQLKCKQGKCPKFFLQGCECPVYCERKKKPDCKKRPAPYPSYSEACVEELDENPSECVQCPWKHCPDFKPQNRGYHSRSNIKLSSAPKSKPLDIDGEDLNEDQYAYEKKRPCQRPDSRCEKRRKLIERLRKEKEREECENRKKNKCSSWTEAVRNLYIKQNNIDILEDDVMPPLLLNKRRKGDYQERCPDPEYYEAFEYDPKEADYEHKRKRLPFKKPCCPPKGKSRAVKDCPPKCGHCAPPTIGGIMEQLRYDLAGGSGYDKCPPMKKKYPDVDHTMNLKKKDPEPCDEDYHDPDYLKPTGFTHRHTIQDRINPLQCPCKPPKKKEQGKTGWRIKKEPGCC